MNPVGYVIVRVDDNAHFAGLAGTEYPKPIYGIPYIFGTERAALERAEALRVVEADADFEVREAKAVGEA